MNETYSGDSFFILSFKGHTTSIINCTASAVELKGHLQELQSIGDIMVTKQIDTDEVSEWLVTFTPNEGNDLRSMMNYGNFPEIAVAHKTFDISVKIETLQN